MQDNQITQARRQAFAQLNAMTYSEFCAFVDQLATASEQLSEDARAYIGRAGIPGSRPARLQLKDYALNQKRRGVLANCVYGVGKVWVRSSKNGANIFMSEAVADLMVALLVTRG